MIRNLSGGARHALPVETDFATRILQHVLAPVFAGDSARGRVKASLIADQAQLDGAGLAGFPADGRQTGNDAGAVGKLMAPI